VRDASVLTRELLGCAPDEIKTLVAYPDRATWLVTVGSERFAVKTDAAPAVAHEVEGHRRALDAGLPVPELIAVAADAFAMRWVTGTTLSRHSTAGAWHAAGAQIRRAHDLGGHPPFGTGFGGFEPEQPAWRLFFEAFAEHMVQSCERDLDFPSAASERIRQALRDAGPLLDAPHLGWNHGDLQPEHMLLDPATDRVAGIIDWADNGYGDVGWDIAVLTMDHEQYLDAFLAGYGASDELRTALDLVLPLFRVVRLVGEAGWMADHGFPFEPSLRRAIDWRP
jgi:aminoglycoside phosphotransferase (APT) family kinase protein